MNALIGMTTPNVSKNIEYDHCAIIDETLKSSIIGTNAVVTMDCDVAKLNWQLEI